MRTDRTIQKSGARRTDLVVSYDDARMTSLVSVFSVQRAHFTFSTQGTVTHSQTRGSEAGAWPTYFMSARLKPLETPKLSRARHYEATRETKMHSKSTSPSKSEILNELTQRSDFAPTHARAGGWHGSSGRNDPELEA